MKKLTKKQYDKVIRAAKRLHTKDSTYCCMAILEASNDDLELLGMFRDVYRDAAIENALKGGDTYLGFWWGKEPTKRSQEERQLALLLFAESHK